MLRLPTRNLLKFNVRAFGGFDSVGAEVEAAQHLQLWQTENRAGCVITIEDKPGRLNHIL